MRRGQFGWLEGGFVSALIQGLLALDQLERATSRRAARGLVPRPVRNPSAPVFSWPLRLRDRSRSGRPVSSIQGTAEALPSRTRSSLLRPQELLGHCVSKAQPCRVFNDTAATDIYALTLHDALPISKDSWRWTSWSARRPGAQRVG